VLQSVVARTARVSSPWLPIAGERDFRGTLESEAPDALREASDGRQACRLILGFDHRRMYRQNVTTQRLTR